jgi:hypothetical protein
MQKGCEKNLMVRISIISLMILLCVYLSTGCRDSAEKKSKDDKSENQIQLTIEDRYPSNVRFSSFQNPDSTWGFTIFVNSHPFLHYKKIPVNKAKKGFASKKDAESVAEIFTQMVKEGNTSPKITRKGLDTLGIIIRVK